MSRWLRSWGPALACAVAIFLASGRSTVPIAMDGGLDKLYHFAAYLVLGAALAWGGARRGVGVLTLIALGVAYAASDELHQALVPGRAPDPRDWLADAAGVAAGVALFLPRFARRTPLRGASRTD